MGVIIVWAFFAICCAIYAPTKGRSGVGWFLLGCIFGVFALILLAVLPRVNIVSGINISEPDRLSAENPDVWPEADLKTCPNCAENVQAKALICRYCGTQFLAREPSEEKGFLARTPLYVYILGAPILALLVWSQIFYRP